MVALLLCFYSCHACTLAVLVLSLPCTPCHDSSCFAILAYASFPGKFHTQRWRGKGWLIAMLLLKLTYIGYWRLPFLCPWVLESPASLPLGYWSLLLLCPWGTGVSCFFIPGVLESPASLSLGYWNLLLLCPWGTGVSCFFIPGVLESPASLSQGYWSLLLLYPWGTGVSCFFVPGVLESPGAGVFYFSVPW